MSYQLNQQKGKTNEIEMPLIQDDATNQPEIQADQNSNTEQIEQKPIETLQSDTQVVDKVETTPTPTETSQAKNFRVLREKAERAERERDELLRRFQEMEVQKSKPTEEDDFGINNRKDDLLDTRDLDKIAKKYRKLEQELQNYKKESSVVATEVKLKAQYPDFDKVVSRDNVEALKMAYPELAATLNASNDLYNTAVSAYTLIKKLGIHTEDLYEADRLAAQKNASKPKPLASISPQQSDSPLSKANAFANGLTDELKVQLRKEMEEARKNR